MTPGKPATIGTRKAYSGKKISAFSFNLQAARLAKKLRLEDLARATGMTKGQLSKYEAGVFPSSAERLIALADALGVTCDELLRSRNKE
jgi:transcriptional regulator with XRE-family HTH domain